MGWTPKCQIVIFVVNLKWYSIITISATHASKAKINLDVAKIILQQCNFWKFIFGSGVFSL
jgi:hypothetical protein